MQYGNKAAWKLLSSDALSELSHGLAGLPSELESEAEEAKRFDLLMLNLQLSILMRIPAKVDTRTGHGGQ